MIRRDPIEAVLFDWGGTLTPWNVIDPLDPWRAFASVLDPVGSEALAQRILAAEEARWSAQRASDGHHGTGPLLELLAEAGIEPAHPRFPDALDAYLAWWDPHTVARDDAAPLLTALRARGLRVGVLSNTQWPAGHHDAVLERDGLLDLLDGTVYSSELPVGKPHADAFAAALSAVRVTDPARAVFVGDRPYDDVYGAQCFGMRGILLTHGNHNPDELPHTPREPDAVVASLAEVLPVIDRWCREVTP